MECKWYSVSVVVHSDRLPQAIIELRAIGGSGIIVSPVTYIFEEEPPRYKADARTIEIGEDRYKQYQFRICTTVHSQANSSE